MERRDRIVILLTFYQDVREGFKDPPNGGGDGVTRWNKSTWSGPAYTQLRGLLVEMKALSGLTYRHVSGFYMGAQYVRRARCPRCAGLFPPSSEERTQHCDGHQHGRPMGKAVTLEAYMDRVVPGYVSNRLVSLGVDWLDLRWQGECDLPSELRDVLATRAKESLLRGRPLAIAA